MVGWIASRSLNKVRPRPNPSTPKVSVYVCFAVTWSITSETAYPSRSCPLGMAFMLGFGWSVMPSATPRGREVRLQFEPIVIGSGTDTSTDHWTELAAGAQRTLPAKLRKHVVAGVVVAIEVRARNADVPEQRVVFARDESNRVAGVILAEDSTAAKAHRHRTERH